MKAPIVLSLTACVLSGLAFAWVLTGSDSSRAGDGARSAQPALDLEARVDALARENEALRAQLASLEIQPAARPVERVPLGDGFATKEDLEALRAQLEKALQQRGLALDAIAANGQSPQFKDLLKEALGEVRKEESAAKATAKSESRYERLDSVTIPKMNDWLGLDQNQSRAMRDALVARYDRENEMLQAWQNGESDEVLGQMKLDNRTTHMAEVELFLSPEQFQTYSNRGGGGGK